MGRPRLPIDEKINRSAARHVAKLLADCTPEERKFYEDRTREKLRERDLHQAELDRAAAEAEAATAGNGYDHDLDASSPQVSAKLQSLVPLLSREMLGDLKRVVAHRWRVRGLVFDPDHADANPLENDEIGDLKPGAGYRYLFRAITVHECDPDVLTYLRQNGGKGRVILEFVPPTPGAEVVAMPFTLPGEVERPKIAVPMAPRGDVALQAVMQGMAQMFEMLGKQNEAILTAIQGMGARKNISEAEVLTRIEAAQLKTLADADAARQNDPNARMGAQLRDMIWASGMKRISDGLNGTISAPPPGGMPMQPAAAPGSSTQLLAQAVSSVKQDLAALPTLREDLKALAGEQKEPSMLEMGQQALQMWGMFQALKNGNGAGMMQMMADMARLNAQSGGMPAGAPAPALSGPPANMPMGDAILGDLAKKMAVA